MSNTRNGLRDQTVQLYYALASHEPSSRRSAISRAPWLQSRTAWRRMWKAYAKSREQAAKL